MTTPHDDYTCQQRVAAAYENGHDDGYEAARLDFERGWDRALDLANEVLKRHTISSETRRRIEEELLQLQQRPQWREEQVRDQIAAQYEAAANNGPEVRS